MDSWRANADPWSRAVRGNQIESRVLVTNAAIVDAVLSRSPASILDIGCGEGWLVRALAEHGVRAIGVDAVPQLIEHAKEAGGGEFRLASYDDLAAGALNVKVDVAVANFSLIGKETVESLLRHLRALLNPGGAVIIQTLHPISSCGDLPYEDGWRTGSWAGFSEDFTDPAPWYFRTLESWRRLLEDSGFAVTETREPIDPRSGKAASVIFAAEKLEKAP